MGSSGWSACGWPTAPGQPGPHDARGRDVLGERYELLFRKGDWTLRAFAAEAPDAGELLVQLPPEHLWVLLTAVARGRSCDRGAQFDFARSGGPAGDEQKALEEAGGDFRALRVGP